MRSRRRDRGAAAVEFALILPVLLLLVGGVVDFGRVFFTHITLSHAAREGVRVWTLGKPGDVVATVESRAAGLTVTTDPASPTDCTPGAATTLTVSTSITYFTPVIAAILPTELDSQGVMRCGG